MKQKYECYSVVDNKVDLRGGFVNEDFKGDWDLHREMFKKERDEKGQTSVSSRKRKIEWNLLV